MLRLTNKKIKHYLFFIFSAVALQSCYWMRPSNGGGEIKSVGERKAIPDDIAVPGGYKVEVVANGLTFPSAVTFDEHGRIYVIETGYSYGEVWGEPKLLRIENDGKTTVIAKGEQNGPWTGATFHNGSFYIAEGGEAKGGSILKITPEGQITTLISNLPSVGDHHTNGPVIKDNYIYFGQGTATNAGVVGTDNQDFGWLIRKPSFHDIPCQDIFLTGENYESPDVLTSAPDDKAITGAFSAFNAKTEPGQQVKGQMPCTGSVLRIPLGGGSPELVAWGFRNPFGLAIAPDGRLYITENGYDDRGSRPVWGAGDVLWEIQHGLWYGWPDFSAGKPISGDEEFKVPGKPPVKRLLQRYPNTPPKPAAILGVHSSSNGLDFSDSEKFGYKGQAFIAQFGDMAPDAGKVLYPVGFKVVRVDVETGVVEDFAINKGSRNGPASWLKKAGLERPLSVKFSPDGNALYVVDFGILKMTETGPQPQLNTGMVWKITRKGL